MSEGKTIAEALGGLSEQLVNNALEDAVELTIQLHSSYSHIYDALEDSAEVRQLFIEVAQVFTVEAIERRIEWGSSHDWMLATETYAAGAYAWLELRGFNRFTAEHFQSGMKTIMSQALMVSSEQRETAGTGERQEEVVRQIRTTRLSPEESVEIARLTQGMGVKPDTVSPHWHVPDFENPEWIMQGEYKVNCILCNEHYELQVGQAYEPTAEEGWIEPSYMQ